MLNIEDLHVEVDGKEILHGLNLRVPPGEVHAVMGPNGSGKSTLAYTLAGREGYAVTRGRVLFQGHDLTAMKPEERAPEGVVLAFQYPVEIPGVSNANFLKSAVNAVRSPLGVPSEIRTPSLTLRTSSTAAPCGFPHSTWKSPGSLAACPFMPCSWRRVRRRSPPAASRGPA